MSTCNFRSPGPEAPRIEMDETCRRIIADPTVAEVQSGSPQLVQPHARNGDVDSLPLQVQAVLGDTMTFTAQQTVILGRTVARNDVEFVSSPQLLIHQVEMFDDPNVHIGDCSRIMAAEDPVEGLEGVGDVVPIRVPVVDGESFP